MVIISPWKEILIAVATAAVIWIAGCVSRYIQTNVKIESPISKQLSEVIKSLNEVSELQNVMIDSLIVLSKATRTVLETAQGKINGNVEIAISMIDESDSKLNAFLLSKAKTGEVHGGSIGQKEVA